jgi:tetratricopeptide (TPR) repeat protein
MGIYFLELMDYERACEVLKSVIEQARQLRRVWMMRDAQNLLVTALVRADQLEEASRVVTDDFALDGVPRSPDAKAELLYAQGRWEEALQRAETVASQVDAAKYIAEHAAELELQGRILLRMGRTADALTLVERALLVGQETAFLPLVWRLQADKGEGLCALGDGDAMTRAQQAAADIIKQLADTIPDPNQRRHFRADAKVASVLLAVNAPSRRRRSKRR